MIPSHINSKMSKPILDIDKVAKKKKSKSLLMGSVVAVIIAITPYIFYFYNWLKVTKYLLKLKEHQM